MIKLLKYGYRKNNITSWHYISCRLNQCDRCKLRFKCFTSHENEALDSGAVLSYPERGTRKNIDKAINGALV